MYKLCALSPDGQQRTVKRIADSVYIPFDPANTDYQAYLAWLEEGNEVLPADEVSGE
jgi:hypothetical protein